MLGVGAIFFDVGGVLISAALESYADRAAQLFRCDPEALKAEVANHVRELERGELSTFAFWTKVGEALERDGLGRTPHPRKFLRVWSKLMLDSVEINLPLFHLCQYLAQHNVVMGLISNTIEDHAVILEELGVYAPFWPRILSCREGVRKPEPEIYRLACQKVGLPPQRCLLIDDAEYNLYEAHAQGMRTHLYTDLEPLVQSLGKLRLLKDYKAPLALAVPVQVHNPDSEFATEPPEPAFQGPPCDTGRDPWLVAEAEFPWGQPLREQLFHLGSYGMLAPCHYNLQPWKVRVEDSALVLVPEPTRPGSLLDSARSRWFACGAASFLIALAARFYGFDPGEPELEGEHLRLRLSGQARPEAWTELPAPERAAFRALPYLRIWPGPLREDPVAPAALESLGNISGLLSLVVDKDTRVALVHEAVRTVQAHWGLPGYRQEVAACMREHGLPPDYLGGLGPMTPLLSWLVPWMGPMLGSRESQLLQQAPLMAVVVTPGDEPCDWVSAGRVSAEFMLKARALGLGASLVDHPIESQAEAQALAALVGREGRAQALLRLGHSHNVPPPRRRPLSEKLHQEG